MRVFGLVLSLLAASFLVQAPAAAADLGVKIRFSSNEISVIHDFFHDYHVDEFLAACTLITGCIIPGAGTSRGTPIFHRPIWASKSDSVRTKFQSFTISFMTIT